MTDADFYDNIEKWIEKDVSEWNRVTLVAYFCYKYQFKNKNNPEKVPFRLTKSKRGSLSSKELADLSKLFNIFAPENFSELEKEKKKEVTSTVNIKIKNYINWMFDYKFRSGSQSVNSTKLFLMPGIIVEFERMYAQHLNKQNNADKMEVFLKWCHSEAKDVLNKHQLTIVGDLLFFKKYVEQYKLSPESLEVIVLNKAIEFGLLD